MFHWENKFRVSRRRQRAFNVHENKPIVDGGDVQVDPRAGDEGGECRQGVI